MSRVLGLSSVMGALAFGGTFVLYLLARHAYHLPLQQVQTVMFLQLIAGGHLMLFLTRVRGPFWRPPLPAKPLLLAILGTQIIGVAMAGLGWLMPAISWTVVGMVWLYNIVWMIVADFAKLGVHRLMDSRAVHQSRFLRTLNASLQPSVSRLQHEEASVQRAVRQAFGKLRRQDGNK